MEVALIPPIPDLERAPHEGIHLLLLHLAGDERYVNFYKDRRRKGDYLILDNGAHELGAAQPHDYLLRMCKELGAQELVMPDVLFDRRGTVERTKRMLKWITTGEGAECYVESGSPKLMFVPQGTDRAEWALCFSDLIRVWDHFSEISSVQLTSPVIGISKDYDDWRGGLRYLIDHYVAPFATHEDRQWEVHCLGWPSDLWSLAKVAKEFPWIRSTDSAKPFVYAKNGILLEPGGKVPKYPKRDPLYFEEPLDEECWDIAERNCLVYRAAANNELIQPV